MSIRDILKPQDVNFGHFEALKMSMLTFWVAHRQAVFDFLQNDFEDILGCPE